MTRMKKLFWIAGITILAFIAVRSISGNYLRPLVFQLAMPTDYFEPERSKPDEFIEIAKDTYAFRHGFNRSLIAATGEKLAVFDTFSREHARALQQVLASKFPRKTVGWVFYSHHHLDHI